MGKRSLSAVAILGLNIGISGLRFGAFATWQVLTAPSEPDVSELSVLIVGLWENISKNKDNPDFNEDWLWFLEVPDVEIYNEDYLKLNQSTKHVNTRFHFIKRGWYRVYVNMLWVSLEDARTYYLFVHKDGDSSSSILSPAAAYYKTFTYRTNMVFMF